MSVVAYLSDLEGRWSKLASFAEGNPYVSLQDDELRVATGARLVFGGDAVDRGPEGRRILRALVRAKRAAPDQVVLLAGNRDINKLRLLRELDGEPPARAVGLGGLGGRADLLRWIFAHTMGARDAFEHRRTELTHERGTTTGDEEVAESFLEDLAPGGAMREFLVHAQLAHVEDGTLFVHGGLSDESIGYVPGEARQPGLLAWLDALNDFHRRQMEAFEEESARRDRPPRARYADLIAYQAPLPGTRANPTSVVYGRTVDACNNPLLPSPEVRRALVAEGISRTVVGHTPSGDFPCTVREGGFQHVVADASHAEVPGAPRLYIERGRIRADGEAALRGGIERAVLDLGVNDRSPIGHHTADGHLVIGQLEGGRWLAFKAMPGYARETLALGDAEVAHLAASSAAP